ncbi:FKBP-type peptidyl-prolyl cis-trans isomerase [Massilia endophytica]|uniref:FKBP-type peptidyl-prolyl cis-trans isomerase n=1 Tax=Massilia endophytica TaxID=2899220 RepID=UPI001E4F4987|nr:FKBP-type peptidyl-prolyl cis-trans isomerase [Massilia endophytica]UGQ46282.1 FKBP-type peptidyl-prolyl cis-trans isomerase [Massilia endophytica]
MKSMFQIIAALACALTLTACGGGGDDKPADNTPAQPAFTKTDTVVGSGLEASNGDLLTVHYTGWVYSATATGNKGDQFETSRTGNPFSFTIGRGSVIPGWDQGILGMKPGGKRTLVIPAAMAYGAQQKTDATGKVVIPANSALVFEVELISLSR